MIVESKRREFIGSLLTRKFIVNQVMRVLRPENFEVSNVSPNYMSGDPRENV